MCSLHTTHPSAPTPGAVGSRRCGTRRAVGGSAPHPRVLPQPRTVLPEQRLKPTPPGHKSDTPYTRPRPPLKRYSTSWICMSSFRRGHANLLCIDQILCMCRHDEISSNVRFKGMGCPPAQYLILVFGKNFLGC